MFANNYSNKTSPSTYFSEADYAALSTNVQRNDYLDWLSSTITPAEFSSIFELYSMRENDNVLDRWLTKNRAGYECSGKTTPEPFERFEPENHIAIYRSDCTSMTQKKTIVAFAGLGRKLMMPVHVFLQHLDSASVDVVVVDTPALLDAKKMEFFQAQSPEENKAHLIPFSTVIKPLQSYTGPDRCAVIGVSFGALPAVLAAAHLNATHCLGAGTGSPYRSRWISKYSLDPVEALQEIGSKVDTKYQLAFGAGEKLDEAQAHEIEELLLAQLLPVGEGHSEKVGHACLYFLAQKGLLSDFLREHLALV